jgi:hypothetical protein
MRACTRVIRPATAPAQGDLHKLSGPLQLEARALFQVLEDARLEVLGIADSDEWAGPLEKLARSACHQLALLARPSGSTPTPRSLLSQGLFAVKFFALAPPGVRSQLQLHPRVRSAADAAAPSIDATRAGTSEDCGVAAVQIVRAISRLPH